MEGEPERELGMPQHLRDHILNNIERLIRATRYTDIMNETVRRGLLNHKMRQIIETRNNMSEQNVLFEQHKLFFQKITKRGPQAYEILTEIVRSLNYTDALRILEDAEHPNCGSTFVSLSSVNRNSRNNIQGRNSNNNGQGYNTSNNTNTNNNNNGSSNKSTDIVDNRIHNALNGDLEPWNEPIVGQKRVVIKSNEIHMDPVVGQYTMQSEHDRGVLFVVNVIDFLDPEVKRNGATTDGDSLKHVFNEMGFKVFYYENLKKSDFLDKLGKLTNSEYVRKTECFMMVIMSHGDRILENDRVHFSDGSQCFVKEIMEKFQADKCPYLIDKPKVLILPFCRGDQSDHGTPLDSHDQLKDKVQTDGKSYSDYPRRNVPTLSDLLVAYASTPGFKSFRDTIDGSWYIQGFCDALAKHAHNRSLDDILMITQKSVGNNRTSNGDLQTGEFNNLGFSKKLYLNPGFHIGMKPAT